MVLLYTFQTHLTFAWNFYYLKKKNCFGNRWASHMKPNIFISIGSTSLLYNTKSFIDLNMR
jgi:hypothetical protein